MRNDGVIEAAKGRTLMAAGDIYGMAVVNTGRVVARSIKIDGGKHGEVRGRSARRFGEGRRRKGRPR